jgi:radical SAM superfamily enzyme YgiQ (UPF0313 family)
VPISTARGCPYRCNWCAKPIWGRTLNTRPAADVAREVAWWKSRGADRVWFTDDLFATKPAWLAEYAAAVGVGGLPFRCLSRADLLVRDGFAENLARAGCVEVWMGAESGSQQVLDAMDKDQDVDEIFTATRRLRAQGVRVGFFLQLGYPGERLPDVKATIAMMRTLRPDDVGISISYPLPGTPFYDRVKDRLLGTSWETAMDCTLLYEGEYPQAFYRATREVLRHEHAALQGVAAALRLATGRSLARRDDLRRTAVSGRHLAPLPWLHLQMRWYARPRQG